LLLELTIRDFAIIDELHLTFGAGFNVLTGETGAGKSIIIDAVGLLLGDRASPEMVRSGTDRATIEGIFALPPAIAAALQPVLEENGLTGDDHELILAREIRRNGRSICRVNGYAVNAVRLSEIGGALVDIHGQSEHLSLMAVKHHGELLDRYANLESTRSNLARLVRELNATRKELAALRRDERELARRVDLLTFQTNEIDAASLKPDEDQHLEIELRRLANAEQLAKQCELLITTLEEGGDEQRAALDLIGQASHALGKLARIDATLDPMVRQLDDVSEQLLDLVRTLRDYSDEIEFNPERLQDVEERLALIYNLKRKYGDSIADILAFATRAQAELDSITHAGERIEALVSAEEHLLRDIGALGTQLSQARRAAATTLARAVEAELADLRMERARFAVDLRWIEDANGAPVDGAAAPGTNGTGAAGGGQHRVAFDTTGLDRIEFLVSANPGEPLKPLVKVASGGETSRLMLALKTVLSQADATPTLIFDEIDVGIGGRVGATVGEKLWSLHHNHQVLCITHLPQLAAFGDVHFHVSKQVEGEHTNTHVQALTAAARVEELAQMLGTPTDAGRHSALELLTRVEAHKASAVTPLNQPSI
jgi:DNA repair protein RecN (Recombination protein N)